MADPRIGQVINQRYQLVKILGQGAMGQVYGARDLLLGGVPVAVKFLVKALLSAKMCDRFEREATTSALLGQRSIHIVRVTDYGMAHWDNIPFYVMEYLEGESLNDIIVRQAITLPRFLTLTRQICLGLQCAHEGIPIAGQILPIVHCDIKPSNILSTQDASVGELVKILDFGIAKVMQLDCSPTRVFMGTLAYASPEQMAVANLDARSDIYSLGVMMYQMISGQMPFQIDTHNFDSWYRVHQAQSPRALAANAHFDVPQSLEDMIMSCLAKVPSDRPQSVRAISAVLAPLLDRFRPDWQPGQEPTQLAANPITAAQTCSGAANEGQLAARTLNSEHRLTAPILSDAQDIFQFAVWPLNKPMAKIYFPQAIRTTQNVVATLWVMLDAAEIQQHQRGQRHHYFLFDPHPHPTLLWLTVLYQRDYPTRWLPTYLDLNQRSGQQIARSLCESGQYFLLFFADTQRQPCLNLMPFTLAAAQRQQLQTWITSVSIGQFNANKPALKNISRTRLELALADLKLKIQQKLDDL